MTRMYSPAQSIERFAQVSAVIDHGLAPRAFVLCAAGLGDETWDSVEQHWICQLGSNDGSALAARFGASYAASVRSLSVEPANAGCESGPDPDEEDDDASKLVELPGFWSTHARAAGGPASHALAGPVRATILPPRPRQLGGGARPGGELVPRYDPRTGTPLEELEPESTLELRGLPDPSNAVLPFVLPSVQSPRVGGAAPHPSFALTAEGDEAERTLEIPEPPPGACAALPFSRASETDLDRREKR